jgi:hypothetical protein
VHLGEHAFEENAAAGAFVALRACKRITSGFRDMRSSGLMPWSAANKPTLRN